MKLSSDTFRWIMYYLSLVLATLLAINSMVGAFQVEAADRIPSAQIAEEVQDHLYHADVFKHGKVQVAVGDGVATLSGSVDSVGVKMDAQNAAMKDEDIVRIVNNIHVDTDGVTPNQIAEQARRRLLASYAYTVFDHVEVEAHGNTLIVLGQVTQPYKKAAVVYSLAHIRGVEAIDNKIRVMQLSPFDDNLRMQVARAIYDDPNFSEYVDAGRLPIHIIAFEGDITLEGVVDSRLDRARAEADARMVPAVDTVTDNLRLGSER